MAKKKKPRRFPARFRSCGTDITPIAQSLLDMSREKMLDSYFHGEIVRSLLYESEEFVVIPARITGEENYPLCIFRARLGHYLVEATLN